MVSTPSPRKRAALFVTENTGLCGSERQQMEDGIEQVIIAALADARSTAPAPDTEEKL